jgi:hypothetical protein
MVLYTCVYPCTTTPLNHKLDTKTQVPTAGVIDTEDTLKFKAFP